MIERYYASAAVRSPDGKFLAMHHIKKTQHPWRFPGGKIEDGELAIQAVIREVAEEIDIVPTSLKYIGQHTTHIDGGIWTGHFFLIDSWVGVPKSMEPDKIGTLEFLTPEELLKRDSHPEYEVTRSITQ